MRRSRSSSRLAALMSPRASTPPPIGAPMAPTDRRSLGRGARRFCLAVCPGDDQRHRGRDRKGCARKRPRSGRTDRIGQGHPDRADGPASIRRVERATHDHKDARCAMTIAANDLGVLGNLAVALGIFTSSGEPNPNWFGDPEASLKMVLANDDQRDALVAFVDEAMGGADRTTDPTGVIWLPIVHLDDPDLTIAVTVDEAQPDGIH